MLPVLLLVPKPSTWASSNLLGKPSYLAVKRVLDTYKIPYVETDSVGATGKSFSGAILPLTESSWTELAPWFRGQVPYPVLCMECWSAGIVEHGIKSVSAAVNYTPGSNPQNDADYAEYEGLKLPVDRYQAIELTDPTKSLFTLTTGPHIGKCIAFRFTGTGHAQCMGYASSALHRYAILKFLNDIGAVAGKPGKVFLNFDDASGNYTQYAQTQAQGGVITTDAFTVAHKQALLGQSETTYVDLMEQLADWARENKTQLLCGMIAGDIARLPSSHWDIWKRNPDVFPMILHDHDTFIFGNDTTVQRNSPANKITTYRSVLAQFKAVGLTIPEEGYKGFMYFPGNGLTWMSMQALGRLGVKAVRSYPMASLSNIGKSLQPGHAITSVKEYPSGFAVMPGEEAQIQTHKIQIQHQNDPIQWDKVVWSNYVTQLQGSSNPPSTERLCMLMGINALMTNLEVGVKHYSFHPTQLCTYGGDTENLILMKWFDRICKPIMTLAGENIIRYATPDDWANVIRAK